QNHSAKAAARRSNLKCETRVRYIVKYFPGCIRISDGIVNGGIRRRGNNTEDHALIFLWGKFLRRDFRNGKEHQQRERGNCRPNDVDGWTRVQGAVQMLAVGFADSIEGPVDPSFETMIVIVRR